MLTDCRLSTLDAEETLDFDFVSVNVVAKLIMAAEGLREAFSELDMTSEVVEVTLTPDPPHFRLTTFGYAGTTQVCFKPSTHALSLSLYFALHTFSFDTIIFQSFHPLLPNTLTFI